MTLPDASLPGLSQAAGQAFHSTVSTAIWRRRASASAFARRGDRRRCDPTSRRFRLRPAAAVTAVAHVGTALIEMWPLMEKLTAPVTTARIDRIHQHDGLAICRRSRAVRQGRCESRTDSLLIERLTQLLHDAPRTGIAPSTAPAISPATRGLRNFALDHRKAVYIKERIIDGNCGTPAKWSGIGNAASPVASP